MQSPVASLTSSRKLQSGECSISANQQSNRTSKDPHSSLSTTIELSGESNLVF